MKKRMKPLLILTFMLCILFCMSTAAYAGERQKNFKKYDLYIEDTVTCGDYYFALKEDGIVYKGTSSKKITKKTSLPAFFISDNVDIYFLDEASKRLYKYNPETGKKTSAKKLESYWGEMDAIELRGGYKDFIYLTKTDFSSHTVKSYCYNRDSKKIKTVMSSSQIMTVKNGYAVTSKGYTANTGSCEMTLRKITSSGNFEKIKQLTKDGKYPTFIGKDLYYVTYPLAEGTMSKKAILKKCDQDGSQVKTIKTFTEKNDGRIFFEKITSKYCIIRRDSMGTHKYTYETDKLTKID